MADYPEDDSLTVPNATTTAFGASNLPDGFVQETNEVAIELVTPELDVEKHAVLDWQLASSIQDFEFLNHDEHDEFSTVHYSTTLNNTIDGTRAKNVTYFDELAPGLELVAGSVKVTGAEGASIEEKGADGWTVAFKDLDAWEPVTVEYDCTTTSEGNGLEIVNTAQSWSTNVTPGTPGAHDSIARDDGEVYVNDPHLVVEKSVAESPVQNDDYQRGEEYRVGDAFTYTVTLVNDAPGTFAKNVRLTDDDIPEGFELVSGPQVSGLDVDGAGFKIPYPISGESDSVHGEEETRTIEHQLTDVKKENGSWGWNLDINYLDANRVVTVTWTVRATQDMNGFEVYNRSFATADNQPGDVFWSKDARTGEDYTIVWINSPRFDVQKDVRKTDQSYQVGDVASYDVVLGALKDPGTLARNTVLEDAFATEGTTIVEDSFVITDKPEDADQLENVELNRHVGDQDWHVDMTQAFGDETGYWASSEDWRPIYKDGAAGQVQGEHNPVQAKPANDESEDCVSDDVPAHDYFHVHYEATINDKSLENELIVNTATADSDEGIPASDDAQVTVVGASLQIAKDSTDGGHFAVGDIAEYEVTLTNSATGTTAKDVQIKDGFTTAKAGTVAVVEGSIRLYDNRNQEIPLAEDQISYERNESGNIFGFQIDTNCDLPSDQKLTLRYDVKYLANNGGDVVTNLASAWASNAPEVSDPYETWPEDMDQSLLHVDKGSDKQAYAGGETAVYTHHISNSTDQTAVNVTVHDEVTKDSIGIAQVVKGSIKVWDAQHNAVGVEEITYIYAAGGQCLGFEIETGRDLEPGDFFDVEYQVRFDETVAQQTQVHNLVWAAADNTGKANDEHDVTVYPPGTPAPGGEDGDPSLSIAKDSNKNWYMPGETARYSLLVTNPGEGVAENVRVKDALDSDARALASIVEGSVKVVDATGTAVPVEGISYAKGDDGRVYGIDVATGYDLDGSGSLNVSYDVLFDGSVTGETGVRNTAAASSNGTPDVETEHTVTLDIESTPELDLSKKVDKELAAPGDVLSYTVAVSQPAEGMVASGVVVTDDLPEGFVLDQSSAKVEKDGHQQTVNVEFPDGKLRVSLGDVAYGEEWAVSYSGKIAEDFLGSELENTAIAESPNIPENPRDEAVTETTNPKLEIEKSADVEKAAPGDEISWSVVVTQTRQDATASGVVVTDELPEGFSADQADVTVTDRQGNDRRANVSLADGVLTVELGDLDYNDPATITVPGVIDESFEGDEIANTAIAKAQNVANPVQDDATVTTATVPLLAIEKSADVETASAGGSVAYTVTATAAKDVDGVVVADRLPDGMAVDVATVKAYLNDAELAFAQGEGPVLENGILTMPAVDMAAKDVLRIEYIGTVPDDAAPGDELVNTAVAQADGIDPVEADAVVTVPGEPSAENPLKGIAQTGDRLLAWLADWWPLALGGLVLVVAGIALMPKLPSAGLIRSSKDEGKQ